MHARDAQMQKRLINGIQTDNLNNNPINFQVNSLCFYLLVTVK